MSTDSTELTFVRCPSCRSLVPAVSTRCRMCGATLDASQKAEEEKEGKRSGRVRQRTMSAPSSDLSSAAEAIRNELSGGTGGGEAEMEAPPDEAPAEDPLGLIESSEPEPSSGSEIDDPLSAYIEEVEVSEGANGNGAAAKKSGSEEVKAEPAAPARDAKPTSVPESPRPRVEEPQRQKVIVESGPRKPHRPSNLSFGKGGAEERGRSEDSPRKSENASKGNEPPARNQQKDRQAPIRDNRSAEPLREESDSAPLESRAPAPHGHSGGPEVAGSPSGRLCGWLVSFKDPRGVGLELREGRFFVTQSSLKSNDMVLNDDSISTPHALVAASVAEGMKVQDLMSEKGVWLKRRGNESYQRITEAARLEHGDWIRFGDVEYLISFLPAAGAKNQG